MKKRIIYLGLAVTLTIFLVIVGALLWEKQPSPDLLNDVIAHIMDDLRTDTRLKVTSVECNEPNCVFEAMTAFDPNRVYANVTISTMNKRRKWANRLNSLTENSPFPLNLRPYHQQKYESIILVTIWNSDPAKRLQLIETLIPICHPRGVAIGVSDHNREWLDYQRSH